MRFFNFARFIFYFNGAQVCYADLSCIASVSHFVIDYVTYENPKDSSKLLPILS